MTPFNFVAAIQDGSFDTALETIIKAVNNRRLVTKRELDAEILAERRGLMREALMEREGEIRIAPVREICSNGTIGRIQNGDIVRIKATSRLRPRYLIGVELVFLRARISNAEVRYLVPDNSKFGRVARFVCPMSDLEFVRKPS